MLHASSRLRRKTSSRPSASASRSSRHPGSRLKQQLHFLHLVAQEMLSNLLIVAYFCLNSYNLGAIQIYDALLLFFRTNTHVFSSICVVFPSQCLTCLVKAGTETFGSTTTSECASVIKPPDVFYIWYTMYIHIFDLLYFSGKARLSYLSLIVQTNWGW